VFGWVREMYAYSIASARIGIKYDMEPVPNNQLMVQPPADEALGKAAIWCVKPSASTDRLGTVRWLRRKCGRGG
jgi:hypothetical protein